MIFGGFLNNHPIVYFRFVSNGELVSNSGDSVGRISGRSVESTTDIGEKINNLSKQLNAVAGIALVAVSMSDEGLFSKGMILTSLLSSHEPDDAELL